MKRVVLLVSLCSLAGVSWAQPSPDTLDWHGYFPLAVGNEWQYVSTDFNSAIPAYDRTRITGDTLVNGTRYFRFILDAFDHSFFLTHTSTGFLRYDTSGTVVGVSSLNADTIHYQPDIDFRAAFGDTVLTDAGLLVIGGTRDTTLRFGSKTYPIRAIKTYGRSLSRDGSGCCFNDVTYAYGIGRISDNVYDGPYRGLVYARIDGVLYGAPVVRVAREQEAEIPSSLRIVSLYPNPVHDTTTLTYQIDQTTALVVAVFDVCGRRVMIHTLPPQAPGIFDHHIDLSLFSAGTYFIRIAAPYGPSAVRAVTIWK